MAQASPYVLPPPNPRKLSVSLELDHFPPLPEVAWRVLELTSDLYLGVDKLAEVISRDQTLTARILRIANSAFFQRLCEIKTVKHASTVLGNRKIRGIVIAASLGGILYRSPQGRLLWQHALGVGLAARELSGRLPVNADAEEAFVAGLLHDIGKGLFDYQHPELFVQAVSLASADPDLSTVDAERQVLGVDHLEVGARVAEAWNLPASIANVIRYHHDPSASPRNPHLCAIVCLADRCCLRLAIGPISKPELDPMDFASAAILGVAGEELERIQTDFLDKVELDRALFSFG
ncbi:MAG: HDOD domain-containing protein [Acidobacteriota bacterium]